MRKSILSTYAMAMAMSESNYFRSNVKPENKSRPCINCGQKHTHNNDSCSAECHKNFHATYKPQGGYNVAR